MKSPADDAPSAGKAVEVKASRKVVLARFREHLNETEEITANVPDDIQKLLGERGRMIPDLILGEAPPYELLAVRRTLSATQRHDMQRVVGRFRLRRSSHASVATGNCRQLGVGL